MDVLKSKGFLAVATVFLLIAIPITTYLVVNSENSAREPQAATVCEKDCTAQETSSSTTATKEDLNSDGLVDGADLAIVLSSFGKTGEQKADLNGDNIVNESDVTLIKAKWSN